MTRQDHLVLIAGVVDPVAFKEAMDTIAYHMWRNPGRWLKLDRMAARDVQAAFDKAEDVLTVLEAVGGVTMRGMSGHHKTVGETVVWLTPPAILAALGGADSFDLDPCACSDPRPWPTARAHLAKEDDGLARAWWGRVWLNPPYGQDPVQGPWLRRMAEHGQGTALIFARTDTRLFHDVVFPAAKAMLFLKGRLWFYRPDGTEADHNGGAPSVLVAYGEVDAIILEHCGLPGRFVPMGGGGI